MAQIIKNNRPRHDREFNRAVEKTLKLVGSQGERFAKETITEMGAVDTGLLRNSITYAVDGSAPNVADYSADKGGGHGAYDGQAESESGSLRSVTIGTNVEYAPYVEFGTRRMEARPFLSQAISGHTSEIEEYFKMGFENFL